ncbi:transcription regulator (putative) [Paenibacillus terrae HPL-003]|uniref:Transcription regulator (Putative) n=2 Tax=Paenibacillus TaxID=44249 RepID=G7VSM6_PAETH|nr:MULTISPECIES: helix-turn-helix transcriptional regulator [Paenibacillus]AET61516.1 transcription regulator (putative) [Paenibacillus terrae HPL-003]ASR46816.1 transcriptional regulator [Paenibacillus kribbensis]
MIRFTLEEMLKKREMSMYALSKSSGIRPNTISQWVTNEGVDVKSITIETLDRVCSVLNCQPGDLIKYITNVKESTEPKKEDR